MAGRGVREVSRLLLGGGRWTFEGEVILQLDDDDFPSQGFEEGEEMLSGCQSASLLVFIVAQEEVVVGGEGGWLEQGGVGWLGWLGVCGDHLELVPRVLSPCCLFRLKFFVILRT